LEFHITRVDRADEVVVSVEGEVDMATAPQLTEALGAALESGRTVVVDVAEMTFIDSQGIKALVDAHKLAGSEPLGRLVVRSPRPQVRKMLEITGLDTRIAIEG
jgi:anti-anti-sigma factor